MILCMLSSFIITFSFSGGFSIKALVSLIQSLLLRKFSVSLILKLSNSGIFYLFTSSNYCSSNCIVDLSFFDLLLFLFRLLCTTFYDIFSRELVSVIYSLSPSSRKFFSSLLIIVRVRFRLCGVFCKVLLFYIESLTSQRTIIRIRMSF